MAGRVVWVRIDLNSRTSAGEVIARTANADGSVGVGDGVVVFEPEDGVAAVAYVTAVDEVLGLLYLRVVWDSIGVAPGFDPVFVWRGARGGWWCVPP